MRMAGIRLDRRRFVAIGAAALGSVAAGCDRFAETPGGRSILEAAETITYRAQRMLIGADELAREFGEADISPSFRSNGTSDPDDES
jgi:hypothetical protein